MITDKRIWELADEYNARTGRTRLDFYVVFQRIVLENDGISHSEWTLMNDTQRRAAYIRADQRIIGSLISGPKSCK